MLVVIQLPKNILYFVEKKIDSMGIKTCYISRGLFWSYCIKSYMYKVAAVQNYSTWNYSSLENQNKVDAQNKT